MPKNIHTAQYEGHTFKRVSLNRIYSHVVVVLTSIAEARQQRAQEVRNMWGINVAYWTATAAGEVSEEGRKHAQRIGRSPHMPTPAEIERAKGFLVKGEQGLVDEALARFDEHLPKSRKSTDGLCFVGEVGWCGRPDLAARLASQYPGAVILPANVVTK